MAKISNYTLSTVVPVSYARNPMIAKTVNPAYIEVRELQHAIKIASRIVLFLKLLNEHKANCDPSPNDKDNSI